MYTFLKLWHNRAMFLLLSRVYLEDLFHTCMGRHQQMQKVSSKDQDLYCHRNVDYYRIEQLSIGWHGSLLGAPFSVPRLKGKRQGYTNMTSTTSYDQEIPCCVASCHLHVSCPASHWRDVDRLPTSTYFLHHGVITLQNIGGYYWKLGNQTVNRTAFAFFPQRFFSELKIS